MKIAIKIVGIFVISIFFISIPILCTISFVYNWFPGITFILIVACVVEWVALMNLLLDMTDKQD